MTAPVTVQSSITASAIAGEYYNENISIALTASFDLMASFDTRIDYARRNI